MNGDDRKRLIASQMLHFFETEASVWTWSCLKEAWQALLHVHVHVTEHKKVLPNAG